MTEVATPSGDATRTRISKIGPDGRELWSVALPPGLWGSRSLAALSSGDIAVGACSVTYCFPPEGTPMTSVVLRLSTADGHEVWRAAMPAPSVGSLSADGAGRVVALSAGLPTSSAAGTPARVVLIGAGGDVLLDQATDIRLPLVALGGASGDFLVAGQDASDRPVYERRRSDGALVFREVLDTRHGFVNRIAFAQNGSIALGGSFQDFLQLRDRRFDLGYGSGFLVVASGDGTPQWALADSGLDGSSGVAPYLAFGRDNDVVTYTMTFGKGQANLRSYTRDGALKWRHDFGGIFGTWVNTVAVARNGDVVVGANGTADVPFRTLPYEKSTQFVAVIAP